MTTPAHTRGMPRHLANQPPPIHHWDRYRVFGLFLLAAYALRFGVAYTPFLPPREIPGALEYITAIFPDARPGWEPVWMLGALWLLAGIAVTAAMIWKKLHNVATITVAILTIYWALAYVAAAIKMAVINDALTAASLIITFGLVVYVGLTSRPAEVVEFEEPHLEPVAHRVD